MKSLQRLFRAVFGTRAVQPVVRKPRRSLMFESLEER
jgi:hypothetical protein